MAEQAVSYNKFALVPVGMTNDGDRPGSILMEYFQVAVTIGTNAGDVEVPTTLGSVIGVLPLHFSSVFAAGDSINNYTTDGEITAGAVTVRVNTTSIADGALTIRGFLLGTKSETVLS
jgi:hypothetical protein